MRTLYSPSHARCSQVRAAGLIVALLGLTGCVAPGAWFLNPGAYDKNYIELVETNEAFLEHPTGVFPEVPPPTRIAAGYEPEVIDTDNMDQKILEMREEGWVMIGYSAVNSRETGDKVCDEKMLAPADLAGCRWSVALSGNNPDADPLGDPVDAAIALNAGLVIIQRDYSFSRQELQGRRYVASEGVSSINSDGGSRSGFAGQSSNNFFGSSSSNSNYNENSASVSGGVGPGGASASGSVSATEGSASETGRQSGGGSSRMAGSGFSAFDMNTTMRSKHWATALVADTVDHYAYMVTYWKKVKPHDMVLGVFTDPLPRDLWPVIGTRSARVIRAVIGDTPAYFAELWEGDIIVAVNGESIQGKRGFRQAIDANAGKEVILTVFRTDQFYDLPVELNRGSSGSRS